jgi:hypothetical protein
MVTTEFAAGQTTQRVRKKERLARSSLRSFYHIRGHALAEVFSPPLRTRTSDSAPLAFTELPDSAERHHPRRQSPRNVAYRDLN